VISRLTRPDRQQAVRPARVCRIWQGGRAGAVAGFDQRRAEGLHAQRARGAAEIRRSVRADRTPSVYLLLLVVHPRIKLAVELAHEHGRKIAFIGRSMNSSAEIAERSGLCRDSPRGLLIHPGEMKNFRAAESLRADQRHAGRADVSSVARRRRQPQACQDREGRHGGAVVAHHPGEREKRSTG